MAFFSIGLMPPPQARPQDGRDERPLVHAPGQADACPRCSACWFTRAGHSKRLRMAIRLPRRPNRDEQDCSARTPISRDNSHLVAIAYPNNPVGISAIHALCFASPAAGREGRASARPRSRASGRLPLHRFASLAAGREGRASARLCSLPLPPVCPVSHV